MLGQLRGLLKLFGLRLGKATTPARRAERLEALFAQKPELGSILSPLVAAIEGLNGRSPFRRTRSSGAPRLTLCAGGS